MRWTFIILVLLVACTPSRQLTKAQNPAQLPTVNGLVGYHQFVVKRTVRLEEFFAVARAWIRDHTEQYALQWEKPVFKKTLLYSGLIPSDRIASNDADHYSKRSVVYFITVDAEKDSCKVFLSNFSVSGIHRSPIDLEKVLTDSSLCRSVDRESREVINSLTSYIRKHSERPL